MFASPSSRHVVRVVEQIFNSFLGTRIGVVGKPKLAQAFAQRGCGIVHFSTKRRQLRSVSQAVICAHIESLPIVDDGLDGLVVCDARESQEWPAFFAELGRVVHDQGQVVVIDKAEPSAMSRGALCGGLTDIQQQMVGRRVLTSGVVRKLASSREENSSQEW